jgi:beta-lactam-binding protein with PASTA domain
VGTTVDKNSAVNVVVSKGPKPSDSVDVPDVTGLTAEEAENKLIDALFVPQPGPQVNSDTVEAGKVCSQSAEPGTKAQVLSVITYSVSLGKEQVTVPDVAGKSVNEARDILAKAGLGSDTTNSYSDTVKKDVVISQSVAKDTQVPVNTEIVLEVSLGPAAPVTTRKTITVDLSAVYTEPVETPYKFELRQGDQVPFVLQACDKAILEITLEGFSIQYYDIYLNDIYYETLRVDFDAE